MTTTKKETFEWMQSWADHADASDLPRVLLIGDSITRGYESEVRRMLSGVAYVDYIATSYAIDNPTYRAIVTGMYHDLDYAAVHFNHGLHGWHLATSDYEAGLRALAREFSAASRLISATSTTVLKQNQPTEDEEKKAILAERNAAVLRVAAECGAEIDDLHALSLTVPYEMRMGDGYHYTKEGYALLGRAVAASILAVLGK